MNKGIMGPGGVDYDHCLTALNLCASVPAVRRLGLCPRVAV
jgi:hypothetical protein